MNDIINQQRDRIAELERENAELVAQVEVLRRASVKAVNFIKNGVEFGFIRMPDADCPDPAHGTLPALESALSVMSAQCLRQIQAEAVRSLLGKCHFSVDHGLNMITESMIKYHAERVAKGE